MPMHLRMNQSRLHFQLRPSCSYSPDIEDESECYQLLWNIGRYLCIGQGWGWTLGDRLHRSTSSWPWSSWQICSFLGQLKEILLAFLHLLGICCFPDLFYFFHSSCLEPIPYWNRHIILHLKERGKICFSLLPHGCTVLEMCHPNILR